MSIISQVAFPAFSRVQDQPELLKRYYLEDRQLRGIRDLPDVLGDLSCRGELGAVLLSEKWQQAVLPLETLSAITSLRAIHLLHAPLATAVGKPEIAILNFVIITVVGAELLRRVVSWHEGRAYSWLVFPFAFVINTSIRCG